jgi:hypothetical protein
MSGGPRRRRHGSQNTGVAAGVKPRSREAVRFLAQGFTRGDSPGGDWDFLYGRNGRHSNSALLLILNPDCIKSSYCIRNRSRELARGGGTSGR